MRARRFVALSLFWRTFFLLALLLGGGIFAWVQTLRALEFEPRAVQAAQQIASLVNLARAALLHADGINRVALIKSVSTQRGGAARAARADRQVGAVRGRPLPARDRATSCATSWAPTPMVASIVNGEAGLWVGFSIDARPLLDAGRPDRASGRCRPAPPGWSGSASRCWPPCSARRVHRPADQPAAQASCRSPPAASATASSTRASTRTR